MDIYSVHLGSTADVSPSLKTEARALTWPRARHRLVQRFPVDQEEKERHENSLKTFTSFGEGDKNEDSRVPAITKNHRSTKR